VSRIVKISWKQKQKKYYKCGDFILRKNSGQKMDKPESLKQKAQKMEIMNY
jgi:hypothetical protein